MGCSSGSSSNSGGVLASVNGLLYQNKTEVPVDELYTNKAIKYVEDAGKLNPISFTIHTGFDGCENNSRGVTELNQTERSAKIKYFTMFNNSQITEHKYLGKPSEDIVCASFKSESVNMADSAVPYIEDVLGVIDLTRTYTTATLDNIINVINFNDIQVIANQIVIPDTLVVGYDNAGVLKTDATTQIGDITVGTFSDNSFDYYKYNNLYIKAAKGVDVSSFIQFPAQK